MYFGESDRQKLANQLYEDMIKLKHISNEFCHEDFVFPSHSMEKECLNVPSVAWKQQYQLQKLAQLWISLQKNLQEELFVCKIEWLHPLLQKVVVDVDGFSIQQILQNIHEIQMSNHATVEHITWQRLVKLMQVDEMEYEIDIAQIILNTYPVDEFVQHFKNWRSKGLFYPLQLALLYEDEMILPYVGVDCHINWSRLTASSDLTLLQYIDQIAISFNILSSSVDSNNNLEEQIQKFQYDYQTQYQLAFRVWHGWRVDAIDHLPPSLFVYSSSKDTLGNNSISLIKNTENQVYFYKNSLDVVNRVYTETFFLRRLQSLVDSINRTVILPEISYCFIHSYESLHHKIDLSYMTPKYILEFQKNFRFTVSLQEPVQTNDLAICPIYEVLCGNLNTCTFSTETCDMTLSPKILLWKVDIPNYGLVTVTNNKKVVFPCDRKKIILPLRNMQQKVYVSGLQVMHSKPTLDCVRQQLLHFVQKNPDLKKIRYNTKKETEISNTQYIETLSFFLHNKPKTHEITWLQEGENKKWEKKDEIDVRYAEIQESDTFFRYRDWVALSIQPHGTLQSRLASHVLTIDKLYVTLIPWIQNQSCQTIRCVSTKDIKSFTVSGNNLQQVIQNYFTKNDKKSEIYNIDASQVWAVKRENKQNHLYGLQLIPNASTHT